MYWCNRALRMHMSHTHTHTHEQRLAQHYSNGGKPSTHGSDLLDDDEDGTIPAREMAKR